MIIIDKKFLHFIINLLKCKIFLIKVHTSSTPFGAILKQAKLI